MVNSLRHFFFLIKAGEGGLQSQSLIDFQEFNALISFFPDKFESPVPFRIEKDDDQRESKSLGLEYSHDIDSVQVGRDSQVPGCFPFDIFMVSAYEVSQAVFALFLKFMPQIEKTDHRGHLIREKPEKIKLHVNFRKEVIERKI